MPVPVPVPGAGRWCWCWCRCGCGRRHRGPQVPVLSCAARVGREQPVLESACIHMPRTTERKRVLRRLCGRGGAVQGADHLDAVACRLSAQTAQIGDGQGAGAARLGGCAVDDESVGRPVGAQHRRQADHAATADVVAGDGERVAGLVASQADRARVVERCDGLVQAGQVERGASRHRVGGCSAQRVRRAHPHDAPIHLRRAGVAVVAGEHGRALADESHAAGADDVVGERIAVGAVHQQAGVVDV